MFRLDRSRRNNSGEYTVLCLGAHADDIEIGCGGTILSLIDEQKNLSVHWVVLSSEGVRADEARESAVRFLRGARSAKVVIKDFRNSYFPYTATEIKEYFEELKSDVNPDLILTHYSHDLHQDHRMVSELSWNAFRRHLICEYEIPKYDGDLGSPNLFVPLSEPIARTKVKYILEGFQSQSDKQWFDEETFLSIMRLRGVECVARYAEAFYCRKMVLNGLRVE